MTTISPRQQARSLARSGHYIAAFCMLRISMERSLKTIVPSAYTNWFALRVLKSDSIIDATTYNQIVSAFDHCNAAVHGQSVDNDRLRIRQVWKCATVLERAARRMDFAR